MSGGPERSHNAIRDEKLVCVSDKYSSFPWERGMISRRFVISVHLQYMLLTPEMS